MLHIHKYVGTYGITIRKRFKFCILIVYWICFWLHNIHFTRNEIVSSLLGAAIFCSTRVAARRQMFACPKQFGGIVSFPWGMNFICRHESYGRFLLPDCSQTYLWRLQQTGGRKISFCISAVKIPHRPFHIITNQPTYTHTHIHIRNHRDEQKTKRAFVTTRESSCSCSCRHASSFCYGEINHHHDNNKKQKRRNSSACKHSEPRNEKHTHIHSSSHGVACSRRRRRIE